MTPTDPTNGWQARLIEDYTSLAADGVRLMIWRHRPNEIETVTALGATRVDVVRFDAHANGPEVDGQPFTGLLVPRGVAEAIAAVARPSPGAAEVTALREALKVERDRVDRMLWAQVGVLDPQGKAP